MFKQNNTLKTLDLMCFLQKTDEINSAVFMYGRQNNQRTFNASKRRYELCKLQKEFSQLIRYLGNKYINVFF